MRDLEEPILFICIAAVIITATIQLKDYSIELRELEYAYKSEQRTIDVKEDLGNKKNKNSHTYGIVRGITRRNLERRSRNQIRDAKTR